MNSKENILVLEEFSLLLSNVKIEELCLTLILHCVLYLPHEPDGEDCEVSGAEPGHLPHNQHHIYLHPSHSGQPFYLQQRVTLLISVLLSSFPLGWII